MDGRLRAHNKYKAQGVLAPLIMRPTSRMGNDPSCLPLREGPNPPHCQPPVNHRLRGVGIVFPVFKHVIYNTTLGKQIGVWT